METLFNKINPHNPTPRYYQIYLEIKNAIEEEKLAEGDTLPSEASLEKYFSVSRVTVRKALDRLEREGYIERYPGRGTIVQNYKNTFYWSRLTSFTNDFREQDEKITSIVLAFDVIVPSKKIANLLELKSDEKVYYLERIRLINGNKIALSKSYLSPRIPVVLRSDMFNEETSLFGLLTKAGLEIGDCDETIEAKIPSTELQQLLEMDESSAVFYRERVTYDTSNRPFEYTTIHYNANYYRYYVKNGQDYRERYKHK